ncbi:MFS transporter [Microlunatus elymi]|uniref:MFS transporter n=1 Tax=Microlunatus elymi TaxID=2596828 RepID=UPI001AEFFC54|nr:MFS transporter [Microlunatus elymi]
MSRTTLPLPSRLVRWIGVALALFAVAWGGNQFTPLLVMYRQHSGFSGQAVTLLLAAYVLGIIPALLLGGPLSDRYGRRPLVCPAPVIAAFGSGLLAVGAGSELLLFGGRVLCGVALGLGMAAGSSWLKELVELAEPGSGRGAGRAAMSLSAGFALGAAAAAALAQYAPWPTVLPYLVQIAMAGLAMGALIGTAETRAPQVCRSGGLLSDLVVPAARQRRFLTVVLPTAPWIFGLAGSAYAVLPMLAGRWVGGIETAWSGLHCLIALGCGIAVQPVGRWLGRFGTVVAPAVGMVTGLAGLLLGAIEITAPGPAGFLICAAVLGCGYGLLLTAGLQEVQRLAGPDDLAKLTAVFYTLAYLGFFVPMLLAELSAWIGYPVMFAAGAGLALACLLVVLIGGRDRRAVVDPEPESAAALSLTVAERTRG